MTAMQRFELLEREAVQRTGNITLAIIHKWSLTRPVVTFRQICFHVAYPRVIVVLMIPVSSMMSRGQRLRVAQTHG